MFFAFVLFFEKRRKPPKGNFHAVLEVFLFCSPKRLVFHIFLSSSYCVCCSLFFLFSSLSKVYLISLLFVDQPLFGIRFFVWGGGRVSSVFLLPLSLFACCFETNFPNIPFFKTNLLSSLVVSFFSVAFVFVFMFYVSAFLFMLALFLVCFSFVIVLFFFFLVLLPDYEKHIVFLVFLVFFESRWLSCSLL